MSKTGDRISSLVDDKRNAVNASTYFNYDGTLILMIDGVARCSAYLIEKLLKIHPTLVDRQIGIKVDESDVLPPNSKIKYPHSKVTVEVTFKAEE